MNRNTLPLDMKIRQVPRLSGNAAASFCFDDCIATFASHVGIDYERMYFLALENGFSNDQSKGIGSSFITSFDICESLEKFTGIKTTKYSTYFNSDLTRIIELLNQNIPICVTMKGFNCPWDWRFNEIDTGAHALFLVQYDETKKAFKCLDPYYNKTNVYLSEDDLRKGYISFRTFSVDHNYPYVEPLNLLDDSLEGLVNGIYLTSLKDLSEKIKQNFDIAREIKNFEHIDTYSIDEIHENIYLNQSLKIMVHNMFRFSILLYKFDEWYPKHEGAFSRLADEMKVISEKWEMIRFMLLKMVFAKDFQKISEGLSRRINSIADDQMLLIQEIIKVIQQRPLPVKNKDYTEVEFGEIISLNLEEYFNNIGIGKRNELNDKADFNGIGEYIIHESLPKESWLSSLDTKFSISCSKRGAFDNISCARQVINIENNYYVQFSVLGCSEWGDFKEYFKIIYMDDSYERVLVELNDWTPVVLDRESSTECIECEKSIVDENDLIDFTEPCYLYINHYILSTDKMIKRIELPECENMHIFALSFTRGK